MTALEVAGVVLGFLAVWLTVREDWRCWPVGLLNVTIFAVLFWQARLYAAAGLQVVYAGMAIYGWYAWRHGAGTGGALRVSRAPRRILVLLGAAGILVAAFLGTALDRFTDAALPMTDSGTTAFSLVAQALQTRKWIETWLVWLVVDAVYVVMYISQDLFLTTALYAAFLVLAVVGWRSWARSLGAK
ncbi:MAG TPA: nicotinamide riboside transporter PnuC [Vicinamibacterales bacterium]|nr:nicotinamide riboside transporter PnuC [Vicinamibacterales bacterium]